MIKDMIKAIAILAACATAILGMTAGIETGNGLMTSASVFLALFAWGLGTKWSEQERDRKSGIDKAINDEMDEQRRMDT